MVGEDGLQQRLPIEPPDNGFSAYEDFAVSSTGQSYTFDFAWFRFNDIHFSQDFLGGTLFLSFTFFDAEKFCYGNRVAKLTISSEDILNFRQVSAGEWMPIYSSYPCLPLKEEFRAIEGNMAGGRIDFDERGLLYLGNGDYSIDGHYDTSGKLAAQEMGWEYGAMVAINVNTNDYEVLSRGHRNIQGVTLDLEGNLWAVEQGPRGGDELNVIQKGRNYGWPYQSYGTSYASTPLKTVEDAEIGRHDKFTKPKLAFLPSLATSTSTVLQGFHDSWDGDLLIGTLRTGRLIRVRYDSDDQRVVFAEQIEVGTRIRDVEMLDSGAVALVSDSREIRFLRPTAGGLGGRYVNYRLDISDAPRKIRSETRALVSRCTECHSLERGNHQTAPSLAGVLGRYSGASDFSGYSDALLEAKIVWSEENLKSYIRNPQGTIPGTSMPQAEMSTEALDELVSIIKGLSSEVVIPNEYRER